MGTVVRMPEPNRRPVTGRPRVAARTRRRWRFQPRGLIGLALLVVITINLYVLIDNAVRLIKGRQAMLEMKERLAETVRRNETLRHERDWMRSDEFLREQAHNLGYAAPGETLEIQPAEATTGDGLVKRRRNKPSPAY